MKIYTKKGDEGMTTDFRNNKIHKSSRLFSILGTNDELSSAIGVAYTKIRNLNCPEEFKISEELAGIQQDIQDINSQLANADTKFDSDGTRVAFLEERIDHYTEKMPRLTVFILPSGPFGAAELHHARAIARRAERKLHKDGLSAFTNTTPEILRYVNRLSDYLFTVARFIQY